MSQEFQAIRFHEYGGSDKLRLETLPKQPLKPTEVLVELRYAGVNPIDWKLRSGYLKDFMPIPLPSTPGLDFSGVVAETGRDVKAFKKGQAVFGLGRGSYAQFVVTEESELAPKPESLSFEAAATVPVAALTAWKALDDAGVKENQTVLVLGAAGGVGLFAVQFAALRGAKVIGAASAANLGFVKELGAERAIDYRSPSFAAEAKDADAVIDLVGGESLEKAYGLVKKGGILVAIAGQVSEEKARALGIRATGSGRGPSSLLPEIAELLAKKKIRAEIGRVFPLDQAAAAQDLSQTGHGRGHIVLKVK